MGLGRTNFTQRLGGRGWIDCHLVMVALKDNRACTSQQTYPLQHLDGLRPVPNQIAQQRKPGGPLRRGMRDAGIQSAQIRVYVRQKCKFHDGPTVACIMGLQADAKLALDQAGWG